MTNCSTITEVDYVDDFVNVRINKNIYKLACWLNFNWKQQLMWST